MAGIGTARRDFIGRGWPFPIRLEPDRRLKLVGSEEKIRQSILIILSTAPGERLMRPKFGCGIHDLVFQANTSAMRSMVVATVRGSLTLWEPRIDVLGVSAEAAPEGRNYLLIRIDYRIRSNNAVHNLVYPFFLSEGAGQ